MERQSKTRVIIRNGVIIYDHLVKKHVIYQLHASLSIRLANSSGGMIACLIYVI